jgi:hypothetical protein
MKAGMRAEDYRMSGKPINPPAKAPVGYRLEEDGKGSLKAVPHSKPATDEEYPKHVKTADGAMRIAHNEEHEEAYLATHKAPPPELAKFAASVDNAVKILRGV